MSTKIYEAYRLPLSKVDSAIQFFSKEWIAYAAHRINSIILQSSPKDDKIKAEAQQKFELWEKNNKGFFTQEDAETWVVAVKYLGVSIFTSKRNENGFNLDCFLKLFFDKEWAYIIPVHPLDYRRNVKMPGFKAKRFPSYLKDYSYWNNSDPPDDMTEKEWDSREEKWDKLLENGRPIVFSQIIEMKPRGFMPWAFLDALVNLNPRLKKHVDRGFFMTSSTLYYEGEKECESMEAELQAKRDAEKRATETANNGGQS